MNTFVADAKHYDHNNFVYRTQVETSSKLTSILQVGHNSANLLSRLNVCSQPITNQFSRHASLKYL